MGFILLEELGKEREYGLDLRLVAGKKGLKKKITDPRVHKLGLALAGFTDQVQPHRIHLIGNTELSYLKALSPKKREEITRKICSLKISCFVVTATQSIPKSLIRESERASIPLFKTRLGSHFFIERATKFLEQRLSATTSVHGVLLDVFGVGVLILGRSGIGKSECALDLIMRGHRLVADDMVHIRKMPPSTILGSGFDLVKHHMEIRGLGIIDIRSLFGVEAIRQGKKVDLVAELVEWQVDYDRLGLEEQRYLICGIELPMVRIPVTPGRNLATIIEVAAKNHLLKGMGYHAATELDRKLTEKIASKGRRDKPHGDEIE
ncbi:MAG: HPr(Ser) kinase/phosphatase [Syntrophobacterales bacterium]|nr:MAG: HPr(Ser) kinase/phosphatase [Syntrophobacterales bacterium]